MIDERTVMLYLALIISAVGLVFAGTATVTLLYVHAWMSASVWGLAALIFAVGVYYTKKEFSI
jgi:hypothetical protein